MNFQFYLFQTLSLGPDISTLTGAHLWPEGNILMNQSSDWYEFNEMLLLT